MPFDGYFGQVGDGRWVDFLVEGGVDGGLAVFRCDHDQGVFVYLLVLQLVDEPADRVVDEVEGFEEGGAEGIASGVEVADCLLRDGDGLEVAAKERGDGG